MIGSTRQVRVWAYAEPADLRRGFDGLSALVRSAMGRDELSGDLYLFVSRDRRRAKVLLWSRPGSVGVSSLETTEPPKLVW